MGLLGTLLGWGQHKDAWNAVLANDLVESASPELKRELAERIIIIQQQVRGAAAGTPRKVLDDLSNRPRMVQLNFVTLACNSLGIPPRLRGAAFEHVKNPYNSDSDSSKDRIEACIVTLARKHGRIAAWPGNHVRLDFAAWTEARADPMPSASDAPDMLAVLHRLSTYGYLSEAYRQDTGRNLEDYFDFLGLSQTDRDQLIDNVYKVVGPDLSSSDFTIREQAIRKSFEIIMKPIDDLLT